eukprot:SAG22_NODE_262_length_13373_cov_11.716965_1_plen_695_part_00
MYPADPRFGRTQEAFGEDPFVVGTMATAAVLGNQGRDGAGGPNTYLGSPKTRMISQAKHFFAYDHGGRDGAQTLLDDRSLFEVYARPWERAVKKAGLRGVMASHNAVNFEPMHGSHRWLTSLLRDQLGFGPGYIAADAGNVAALYSNQMVAASHEAAAALAATAGLDQDLSSMVGTPYTTLAKQKQKTPALVAAIDRAAGNVLRLKFAAGLFDSPLADSSLWHERDSPRARRLALEAAEEGIVLLVNRGAALPFLRSKSGAQAAAAAAAVAATPKRIAVIGPLADDKESTLGDYSPKASDSEKAWGNGAEVITVHAGIQNYVTKGMPGAMVNKSQGCDLAAGPINETSRAKIAAAVALHKASDVTVLVVGDSSGGSVGFGHESCGEGSDRHSLDLFGQQMALIDALVAANSSSKLVVVLIHGRPQTFGPNNGVLAKVDALLACWRPGEEGGTAVANVLFGAVSPSGKLTQAWPTDVGSVNSPGNPWSQPYQADGGDTKTASGPTPQQYQDGDAGANHVLFPFGFGLSFSRFNYSQPTIEARHAAVDSLAANETISISVVVQNVGEMDAATVVQIYAAPSSPGLTVGITRNQRVLVGYTKIRVRAGQRAVATVQVEVNDMGRYDPYAVPARWVVDPGGYTLFAQDCAGTRWDAYLLHGQPQWQGAGCIVMGSTAVTIHVEGKGGVPRQRHPPSSV